MLLLIDRKGLQLRRTLECFGKLRDMVVFISSEGYVNTLSLNWCQLNIKNVESVKEHNREVFFHSLFPSHFPGLVLE